HLQPVVVADVVGGDGRGERPAAQARREVRVGDHGQLNVDHVVGEPPAVAQDRAGQDGAEPVRVADLELQQVRQQQAGDDVGGRRGLPEDAGQDALHVGPEVAHVVAGEAGVEGV